MLRAEPRARVQRAAHPPVAQIKEFYQEHQLEMKIKTATSGTTGLRRETLCLEKQTNKRQKL